ncbi:MAG TPA: glutathione S-transferase family protein [Caulobacteraceae bacterium]|nr:glutathione S-transferase family protein [Caulobacteraceae bacterium]
MSERILLYRRLASRAFPVLWILEELGLPYRTEVLKRGATYPPELLAFSPNGFSPALVDGETKLTEAPAICLYLADRYAPGTLAPAIDDPARGPYLRWMVYSTAVLEPARELQLTTVTPTRNDYGVGWPKFERIVDELSRAVDGREWLLGDRFTAADVMLGSVISISLFCGTIPREPALVAYDERLSARPAMRRAQALNWPPEVFGAIEPADG